MDFLTLAKARYSVRRFADTPVEPEKLEKILEAGRLAPTAVNEQPQRIYILKSEEALRKVRGVTSNAYNVPMVLMVCYDKNASWKGTKVGEPDYDAGEMDACIVTTHMMLEAQELGLGTLWARGFCAQDLSDAFHLPEHIVPVCLLDLGYPAKDGQPGPWHTQRKPLEETVTEL
jgi:nitroreductase